MKRTYDVYDVENREYKKRNISASEVSRLIGINDKLVSVYCKNGFCYKQTYKIYESNCPASEKIICAYNLTTGEYKSVEPAKELAAKYNLSVVTLMQYISRRKIINGIIFFKDGEPPIDIILPTELAEDWNNTRYALRYAAKWERQAV